MDSLAGEKGTSGGKKARPEEVAGGSGAESKKLWQIEGMEVLLSHERGEY